MTAPTFLAMLQQSYLRTFPLDFEDVLYIDKKSDGDIEKLPFLKQFRINDATHVFMAYKAMCTIYGMMLKLL